MERGAELSESTARGKFCIQFRRENASRLRVSHRNHSIRAVKLAMNFFALTYSGEFAGKSRPHFARGVPILQARLSSRRFKSRKNCPTEEGVDPENFSSLLTRIEDTRDVESS